jgi:hypothetical protein
MLLGVHLGCSLLSIPGLGLFVWRVVGPMAAIAAAVVAGQCALMLLLAILGWLPGRSELPLDGDPAARR